MMTVEEFKAIRLRLKVSQPGMAKMLDVTSGTVSRWKRGVCDIPGPVGVLMRIFDQIRPLLINRKLTWK